MSNEQEARQAFWAASAGTLAGIVITALVLITLGLAIVTYGTEASPPVQSDRKDCLSMDSEQI